MVVRKSSAQTRRCLHGNQDTCHPAHVGTNLQKDATRRPCQHTTIVAAISSRNGFPSGPLGLGGRARAGHPKASELDPPTAVENRTPSNPRTKNPRTIFGTIFRSVFWTSKWGRFLDFYKVSFSEAEKRVRFWVRKMNPKMVPKTLPREPISVYPLGQKRGRT